MPLRQSKVKHVYGKPNKRDECFDGIQVTKTSWDSTFCAVSSKFLAVITETAGGGAFLVIPLDKPGRLEKKKMPLVTGHKAGVLDLQWSPHNDCLIASASEDCTVKLWLIPEDGVPDGESITEPLRDLVAHKRRAGLVLWHPTVQNVLFSAGADNQGYLWDCDKEEILFEMTFPDMIISASFSRNGRRLVTSCKDKHTRIIDARTGEVLHQLQCHEGSKPQQVVFLHDDDTFLSTGFSRRSERQIAVWNISSIQAESTKPKAEFDLDTTNGTLFPFFDFDLNVVYLCGKGDSVIRYFEVLPDSGSDCLYPLSMFNSSAAQRGFGWLPKRAVNTAVNEVGRCFRLNASGFCEVIAFIVPRKSELFQEDLYPDTLSDQPALELQEWLDGKDCDPVLMSMRPADDGRAASVQAPKRAMMPSAGKTAIRSSTAAADRNGTATDVPNGIHHSPKAEQSSVVTSQLVAEVAQLRGTVEALSARLTALENRLDSQPAADGAAEPASDDQ